MSTINELKNKLQNKATTYLERMGIVDILAKTGTDEVIPVLIMALDDPDKDVQWRAVESLARFGEKATAPLLEALKSPKTKNQAQEALVKIGTPAVAGLIDIIRDKNLSGITRAAAAKALGKIGDTADTAALMEAVKERDLALRREAVVALGRLKEKKALTLLNRLMQNPELKKFAAEALGEIGDAEAVRPLIRAMNDKDETIVRQIAISLVKIGSASVKPLIKTLEESDIDVVREYAALCLGEIKDRQAVEALIDALEDPDPAVRGNAAWALGEIADHRAKRPLQRALKDREESVQKFAEESLKKLENEESFGF